jgi:dihydroxy-acid dehydratase
MVDTPQNRPRSHEVTDGNTRAPARAMLRAIGMTDDDWGKAQVGVASSWNEVTPCNMPLDRLAKRAKVGVRDAGGFPIEFVTIAVSDGISMGHEGMRGSLVSREIITDSVECVMHAERFDALVAFAGCDKSLPGMLMAAARINLPSVFLYGGSILPGHYKDCQRLRGRRRVLGRNDHRKRARRDRAPGLSDRRIVRRHVHGQHHGVGERSDRYGVAGQCERTRS